MESVQHSFHPLAGPSSLVPSLPPKGQGGPRANHRQQRSSAATRRRISIAQKRRSSDSSAEYAERTTVYTHTLLAVRHAVPRGHPPEAAPVQGILALPEPPKLPAAARHLGGDAVQPDFILHRVSAALVCSCVRCSTCLPSSFGALLRHASLRVGLACLWSAPPWPPRVLRRRRRARGGAEQDIGSAARHNLALESRPCRGRDTHERHRRDAHAVPTVHPVPLLLICSDGESLMVKENDADSPSHTSVCLNRHAHAQPRIRPPYSDIILPAPVPVVERGEQRWKRLHASRPKSRGALLQRLQLLWTRS